MTLEEALEASGAEPVNDIFQINQENRTITVPESERIFGVSHDGNTERKHFRCPKIVGDNIDLSTMHLYINYQNANGQKYPYLVEDVQTDGDYITFSWLIGPDVVAYKGQVKFIVCAKKGDGAIPEWNTTLAEGTVMEGLEATDEVVDRNPDIITQLLDRMREAEKIAKNRNFYTWTAFADDENGTGISANAYGKDYLGIATNRLTKEADLSDPMQYTWVKIKGEQGIPGTAGKDGKTTYFHMKYSAVPNPASYSDMTETPNKYIGTYVDYELDDSTDPSKYTWGKFQGDNGEDGADGIPGKNGENGETSYVHFAYATSADGKTGFSTTDTVGKTYMGQYADFEKRIQWIQVHILGQRSKVKQERKAKKEIRVIQENKVPEAYRDYKVRKVNREYPVQLVL